MRIERMTGSCLPFLLVLFACSGGGMPGFPADPGPPQDPGTEALAEPSGEEVTIPEDLAPEPGEIREEVAQDPGTGDVPGSPGTPCTDNAQCFSGYCVETPDGKECAGLCSDSSTCPDGFTCSQVATYPDVVYACVHTAPRVCRPCTAGTDCASAFVSTPMTCAAIDGAYFCFRTCAAAADCGPGFDCVDLACRPSSGACACSESFQNVEGLCEKRNESGTCPGRFACLSEGPGPCSAAVPAPETCNSLDDDCNGLTDDGLATDETCDLTNAYGTCKGKPACLSGQVVCQGSYASPEVCNGIDDTCDGMTDEGFPDQDGDGIADCVDPDRDGDGVPDDSDNCDEVPNPDQADTDHDGVGDACSPDDDGDGVIDTLDNCPHTPNPDQKDSDLDGLGDACDGDLDGDGIPDGEDDCPYVANPGQEDLDGDGLGDACDTDIDGDGVPNGTDNCPSLTNPDQADLDHDGLGDACDPDDDGDGILDGADNCPAVANPDQSDIDADGLGDACDGDRDGDGVLDEFDDCPGTYDPEQVDANGNGIGDACEDDWDGDTVANGDDNCPEDFNPNQEDLDKDGLGDACDADRDGDGLDNDKDNCPSVANPGQEDLDKDGIGDACDADRDGDGHANATDCAPDDAAIHPGATEACNGLDDDCDGQTDEEAAEGCSLFYRDEDADGTGTFVAKCLCAAAAPYTAAESGDCDDKDPKVNPDAVEACGNAKDDDCDAQTDEPGADGCSVFYRDTDADGYGVESDSQCLCKASGAYTASKSGDCDDLDRTSFPGGLELCDLKDNDCDKSTDEEGSAGCQTFYGDHDRDGYGILADAKCLCKPAAPWDGTKVGDCDDADPGAFPGATEKCNLKDDDCDGQTDEEAATACTTYYLDADGDGYGVALSSKCLCGPSEPYSATNTKDCNDSNPAVNPAATEICNGIDDNCSGVADEADAGGCEDLFFDNDGDGFGVASNRKCLCQPTGKFTASEAGDCSDSDKNAYPGAAEVCNGKDDDCDGQTDEEDALGCKTFQKDADRDGFGVTGDAKCLCGPTGVYTAATGGDCDDSDPAASPAATEACGNGRDDNCNGQTDEEGGGACVSYYADNDADGYGTSVFKCLCGPKAPFSTLVSGDCNDGNKAIHPDAAEACNGVDDDCDGQVDEEGATGCATWFFDGDTDGYGVTGMSKCLCAASGKYTAAEAGDCADGDKNVHPDATELCNGRDDDCDGQIDEESAVGCKTWYADLDGDGAGNSASSKCLCAAAGGFTAPAGGDCDDGNKAAYPGAIELCGTGKDEDCDGQTDEEGGSACVAFYADADQDGFGAGPSKCLCAASGVYSTTTAGDCSDVDPAVHPGAEEACNGKDDDCDGTLDEEGAVGCSAFLLDADADGYGVTGQSKCLCAASGKYTATVGGDCADTDQSVHPGTSELCNAKDDNCNGQVDEESSLGCKTLFEDKDGDAHGNPAVSKCLCAAAAPFTATTGDDCDDTDKAAFPGATETCGNGKDDDCDGLVDEEGGTGCSAFYADGDGDTWGAGPSKCLCAKAGLYSATRGGDCADADKDVHPTAVEACNGKDDDCDGSVDEAGATGCSDFLLDADTDGYGVTGQSKCLCAATGKYTATEAGDCADSDKSVHPGALELCNLKDDDCDGATDEEDAIGCKLWYADADGDGAGNPASAKCICAAKAPFTASTGGDCDDTEKTVHPGATETCGNSRDDDCDKLVDEEGAAGCVVYYYDADLDTWGTSSASRCLCNPGQGYTATKPGDCADTDPTVNPGRTEVCGNSKDDDCDGLLDEEGATGCKTFYLDLDDDGYGVTGQTKCLCLAAGNYTATKGGDCDDSDPARYPGALETCGNSRDEDCDGLTDETGCAGCTTYFMDVDGDSWGVTGQTQCLGTPEGNYRAVRGGDCADNDAAVYPGATENCGNARDDDCDGATDEENASGCKLYYRDLDGDGYGTADAKCLCAAATPYTAAVPGDCADNDKTAYPGKTEACDGRDNDCDGATDEEGASGCKAYSYDQDGDGYGITGVTRCLCSPTAPYAGLAEGDCNDNDKNVHPGGVESCNGKDDDCNGTTDDPNASGCTTYYKDVDRDKYGILGDTRCLCTAAAPYDAILAGDCNDGNASIHPSATEVCNGVDDDCDGSTDEGVKLTFYRDADADGYGTTATTTLACTAPSGYVANSTDCNDSNANVNPGATEACNSVDDDCDGATDEGYLLTVTSIDCKTITVTNPGPLTLSNFSVTVDDVVVGSSGPSSLAPGASGTFRLAYVLDGAQKVKVRSGTSGSCTSANFTFNKECAVRLGFALWPDQGGDDLALVRVIDNQGADFKSRTGLDVVTDRSGRTKCDIGYGVVDIDTADLNAYDLLYYHSHSPFYPSATALNRLYTWVSEGGVLIFDDCGGANYADLTTAFGVYVDFTGSTGGPSYASQWILDSDLYRVPYAYSTTEFSNAATWTEGGQKSMSGGVVEIVRRGSSPFVSGKKIGNGWLAFVGGDWGCSLSCSCNVGTTLGYRLMLNFAYIASGRAKLIR